MERFLQFNSTIMRSFARATPNAESSRREPREAPKPTAFLRARTAPTHARAHRTWRVKHPCERTRSRYVPSFAPSHVRRADTAFIDGPDAAEALCVRALTTVFVSSPRAGAHRPGADNPTRGARVVGSKTRSSGAGKEREDGCEDDSRARRGSQSRDATRAFRIHVRRQVVFGCV